MKRVMFISSKLLFCVLSAIGATILVLALTDSNEVAGFAGVAAFVGNLFMIEPIKSFVIE